MGDIKYIKDLLAEVPFFEGMAEPHLELLSGCGQIVHFDVGDFLLKEGGEANSFFLIRKGDVAVESHMPPGGPLTIAKVGANGVVGYSWLFPPYRNAFDSRAITDVQALKLDGRCLRGKAEQDHELGYQFLKRFTDIILQRLQATRRQTLDIYGKDGM